MAQRKRLKRHIKAAGRETPSERQARTAVAYVLGRSAYPLILNAIRSGTPNTKIAEWAITRGYVDVTQKTFVGYLQYFRKKQPGLCKPQEGDLPGYDHLIDGNSVIFDEETELLKLIALQKARIGMAFQSEREINMLMQSNKKEIEELRELIMALAKLRGLVGNTNMNVNFQGYGESVRDDLKSIQQDEGQRNVIATLVTDLAKVSSGA